MRNALRVYRATVILMILASFGSVVSASRSIARMKGNPFADEPVASKPSEVEAREPLHTSAPLSVRTTATPAPVCEAQPAVASVPSETPPVVNFSARRSEETTRLLEMENAPFPSKKHPEALVYVPAGIDLSKPLSVVVFFHGWNGCVQVVSGERYASCRPNGENRVPLELTRQMRDSNRAAMLLVPQFAYDARSSDPGAFAKPGALRAFVAEALDKMQDVLGPRDVNALDRVVLTAHSGGYYALRIALETGGLPVDEVALFDALYYQREHFAAWIANNAARFRADAEKPMRFTSVFRLGNPRSESLGIARDLAARLGPQTARDLVYVRDAIGRVKPRETDRGVRLIHTSGDHAMAARLNFGTVLAESVIPAREVLVAQ